MSSKNPHPDQRRADSGAPDPHSAGGDPEDRLSAALSHQLQTPIAVLQSATANLRRNLRGLLEDLSQTGEASHEGGAEPQGFVSRVIAEPPPAPLTGLLPRDRIDVTIRRLRDAGVEGDLSSAASGLIRGGWDTYLDEIAPLLKHDPARALDILETSARLRNNLAALEASSGRIRQLATALRTLATPVMDQVADLNRTMEQAIALHRHRPAPTAAIEFNPGQQERVSGREDLLVEAWSNLIDNAILAAGPDGRVVIETRRRGKGAETRIEVRIIDDGPGIPESAQGRLFEPFFSTRADTEGTGLGLAVTRRIIDRAKGTIDLESRPGRTCVTVMLRSASMTAAVGGKGR